MHRSGTSALTKVINLLGADLPNDLMVAGEGNENGHWESQAIANFNDEILFSAGSRWNDWLPLAPSWNRSATYEDFFDRACELIQSEYGRSPLFVMKDPRICRLAPFWLDVLDNLNIRPAIILPQRNPLEVGASLAARDGSEMGLGLLLWLRHVLDAEVATRGKARCFMTFTQLLDDWTKVVNAIERNANLSFPRRSVLAEEEIAHFLLNDAKHENASASAALSTAIPVWVRDAFAIFLRWSENEEDSQDYDRLDEIRSAFDIASPSFAQFLTKGVGLGHGHGSESVARRELMDIRVHMASLEDSLSQVRQEADSSMESARALALEKEEKQREAQQVLGQLDVLDKAFQNKLREAEQANAALIDTLSLLDSQRADNARITAEREEKQREAEQANAALTETLSLLDGQRADNARIAAEREEKQREAEQANAALEAVRAELESERDAATALAVEHEKQKRDAETQFSNRLDLLDKAFQDKQREVEQANAALTYAQALLESEREATTQLDQKQREAHQLLCSRLNELDDSYQVKQREAEQANNALVEALALLEEQKAASNQLAAQNEEQKLETRQANVALEALKADLERQYDLALQQEESQRGLERQLRARISMFESALIQRQEEAAQAWAEVDAHRLDQTRLQSVLADERRKSAYLEEEKRELEASLDKYLEDMVASRKEIDSIQTALDDRTKDNSLLSQKINLLESIMETNAQERATAQIHIERLNIVIGVKSSIIDKANSDIKKILSVKDQEKDAISSLKRDNEILLDKLERTERDIQNQRLLTEKSNDRVEWLRMVTLKLQRRPLWWLILPTKKRQERERRMVERNGLFNGAAYLARYPDVEASGMDPLVHYMRHGINENRSL